MDAAEYRRQISRLAEAEKTHFGRKRPSPAENAIDSYASKREEMAEPRFVIPSNPRPPIQPFFIFSRPMKSRLPSGTPLVRRMS